MLDWDERLSIGVLEIDIQHKLLFEKFHEFLVACESETETDGLYRLFWFIEAYTITHFSQEERLMQQVAFPDFVKHRERHQYFAAEVAKLKDRLKNEGPSPSLISHMKMFITGWLIEHISTMDLAIGRFVTASGVPAI